MKIVIRNDEKKDKAVSAIIGTILIVAITVVLAATLYAVLGGFSGLIGKPTPTASMSVSESGAGTNIITYELTFTSISTNVSLSDVVVRVVSMNSTTYTSVPLSSTSPSFPSSTNLTLSVSKTSSYFTYDTTITITDKASSAAQVTALSSIAIIYTPTGGNIAGPDTV
jgi:flagellin-like protein